jgi:thymidylate kinase
MIQLDNYTAQDPLFRKVAIVIEFVGSPGAGKTTSCQFFADMLEKKNLKVCQSQDIKEYIRELNLLKKLVLFSETMLLKGHLFFLFPMVLAMNKVLSLHALYRYVRLAVFNQALTKMVKSKGLDFVLLDQWVIQEFWSATIFKLNNFDKVLNQLQKFYLETDLVFYFNINPEVASERITGRNTNLSRFDGMPPEKRVEALSKYNKYLYQLYEQSGCRHKYVLSAEHSPAENARHFYKQLKKFPKNGFKTKKRK